MSRSLRHALCGYVWLIVNLMLFVAPASAKTEQTDSFAILPEGLAFVGLQGGVWQFYRVYQGELSPVSGLTHPRSTAYQAATQTLVYTTADNRLLERDLNSGEEKPVNSAGNENRYTQLAYSADGSWLLAVEMPQGRSRQTRIVGFRQPGGEKHYFVRKRSAQFEPALQDSRYLYYTTAVCVDDCHGMIWELWRKDLYSARQEQLTLTNSVTTQPHPGRDGFLYFSANMDAQKFHIWRMRPEAGAPPEQLTRGPVRDSEPVTDKQGNVWFIRANQAGSQLMVRNTSGDVHAVDLPIRIDGLRNLEIAQ